jgi:murein DD-endopeptidase MepM/ murein hydrolase activator NlpD
LRLDTRLDTLFKQYRSAVDETRRLSRLEQWDKIPPLLTIYAYVPQKGEDLLFLSSRFGIPYESLATLNRLSRMSDLVPGRPLLLPSAPGLFIPLNPENDLEKLLASSRQGDGEGRTEISLGGFSFVYYPGASFSRTDRAFFLGAGLFQFPLAEYALTSAYGRRVNPVTGKSAVHQGLDLAAPEGSLVFASRAGLVTETGYDAVYGNYVILSHDSLWASLYGHLSHVSVDEGENVKAGDTVGRVGSTGMSTGPHLHFELRQGGAARDPGELLKIFEEK